MKLPLTVSLKLEHYTVICYFIAFGHRANNINAKMMEVNSNLISYNIVERWHCEFLNGRMEIMDEPCRGWSYNEDLINTVRTVTEENGRITVAEIEQYIWDVTCDSLLSHETVIEILPSVPRHEKNLCKMGPKIVGWWAQMEPNGCRLRLHVTLLEHLETIEYCHRPSLVSYQLVNKASVHGKRRILLRFCHKLIIWYCVLHSEEEIG